MKKIILLIILTYQSVLRLNAQDTPYISLENLLQQVETNYPTIMQHQQNIEALKVKAEGAKAWMPPTFGAGVNRFPYNFSTINDKNNPMNQASVMITMEQMIPNPSKLVAKKEYLNSLSEIEKNKQNWTKNELRRDAKTIYYFRYMLEKKQQIVLESEALLVFLIKTSEEKLSNNQSQLQSIYKAKARLAELQNTQLLLDELVAQSSIQLNSLMAKEPTTPFSISSIIEPTYPTVLLADSSLFLERSDIKTITNSINAMQLEQHTLKIANRPDFGIRAEHMNMFGMPNQWSVMGMITIPIVPWSAKANTSSSKAIEFQIEAMKLEKQTKELVAKQNNNEKISTLQFQNKQYQNFKNSIIPAYESNFQINLLAFNQNTGNVFMLLDAWEILLMKKLEQLDTLFTILKLEAEYEYENEIK